MVRKLYLETRQIINKNLAYDIRAWHLRAFAACGISVDVVETVFARAVLQTSERVAPPRARRLPGRGWGGDAQTNEEISMATAARRAAWKRQRATPQDTQLKRAVQQENTRVHRV